MDNDKQINEIEKKYTQKIQQEYDRVLKLAATSEDIETSSFTRGVAAGLKNSLLFFQNIIAVDRSTKCTEVNFRLRTPEELIANRSSAYNYII